MMPLAKKTRAIIPNAAAILYFCSIPSSFRPGTTKKARAVAGYSAISGASAFGFSLYYSCITIYII